MNKYFAALGFLLLFLAAHPAQAATAKADVHGTLPDSKISGSVTLEDTSAGLHISALLDGVPEGKHGFHIHEKGSCEDKGNAAGGHFNPEGAPHGLLTKDGFKSAHAGDLGNVEAGADGHVSLDLTIPGLTVEGGQHSVSGHAVILHEKEDNFGQPTGNAGGRIGCGVIEVSGK